MSNHNEALSLHKDDSMEHNHLIGGKMNDAVDYMHKKGFGIHNHHQYNAPGSDPTKTPTGINVYKRPGNFKTKTPAKKINIHYTLHDGKVTKIVQEELKEDTNMKNIIATIVDGKNVFAVKELIQNSLIERIDAKLGLLKQEVGKNFFKVKLTEETDPDDKLYAKAFVNKNSIYQNHLKQEPDALHKKLVSSGFKHSSASFDKNVLHSYNKSDESVGVRVDKKTNKIAHIFHHVMN